MKEECEKAGLQLNIQKTKVNTSDHTTSCRTDGKDIETVSDFIFLYSKINMDRDCS